MTDWDDVAAVIGDAVVSRLRAVAARGGRLLIDVPVCAGVGRWPEETGDHRADAVWLPESPPSGPAWAHEVDIVDLIAGEPVAIVHADGGATRPQVGRVLARGDMFSRSYPGHGLRRHVVVVDEPQEPNVAWVYSTLGIEVVVVDE